MQQSSHLRQSSAEHVRNGIEADAETGSILVASPSLTASSPSTTGRKRSSVDDPSLQGHELRKTRKVSRACDFCKSRKARCTGDRPCAKCVAKGRECSYDAKYTRGRPPTPPPSDIQPKFSATVVMTPVNNYSGLQPGPVDGRQAAGIGHDMGLSRSYAQPRESGGPSRASPELSMAEIQGQVFDPTSGLTFLHRALKRLSAQNMNGLAGKGRPASDNQPAGDKPLPDYSDNGLSHMPDQAEGKKLLALYFDVCIATYRILHRPTVEGWLFTMQKNLQEKRVLWHGVGRAEAAIVLVALAVARLHHEKSKGFLSPEAENQALLASDELYNLSTRLADEETGFPRLETAQARTVHVLYLLTTSRFNRAWYFFGNALQLVSALGLHRRANSKRGRASRTDYIRTQCGIRTFWTAYILDNYLGVVFGRPRHFHDEDIDQSFPDQVDDEMMTVDGPSNPLDTPGDCHIDALLFHSKIAQIIGSISREIYTLRDISETERLAATNKLMQRVREWHANLPLHLGSIHPSMLIPSYRRQATVLKLAHSHAIMHANRLFLLGNPSEAYESQIEDCIRAAKAVLETVDQLSQEGTIFHAFWWTHYVTFCALVVAYMWEIQQRRTKRWNERQDGIRLIELAERCHTHLAQATASNSPSRRYAVILEEFRNAATSSNTRPLLPAEQTETMPDVSQNGISENPLSINAMTGMNGQAIGSDNISVLNDAHLFDDWHTTDWLDLDSSAFWTQMETDEGFLWSNMTQA
ncbi:hypothetical protein FDECE_5635 [Fusarium decemcellulare]|nr:hypothetical protein FDECE_5635 [Fusarium decemcellulare]